MPTKSSDDNGISTEKYYELSVSQSYFAVSIGAFRNQRVSGLFEKVYMTNVDDFYVLGNK